MPVWIVIGVAAAVFVLVFVVAATFNVFSSETVDEAAEQWNGLPDEFTSADVESVRFRPALRGYRMEDVDAAMSMLHARLRDLEAAAAPVDETVPAAPTAGTDATTPAEAAPPNSPMPSAERPGTAAGPR